MAVVPMFDPPRHDTKETIERCIDKGIAVKMVTGAAPSASWLDAVKLEAKNDREGIEHQIGLLHERDVQQSVSR